MDRLTATRTFVTVADHGSLTRAAEVLDLSTAMVSRHLAALEAWLGTRLLHRTTRRVGLTEAGAAALASCHQLLELADDLRDQAAEARRVPTGRLRIASSPSFAEAQLAPALVDFQARHPQVRFQLRVTDHAVDLTAERIDLAVRITNALEPTQVARRLADCHSVLCAAPAYLAAHGTPATPADLTAHRTLAHERVSAAQFRLRQGEQVVEVPFTEGLASNDTAVLRRAALAGGGLAMLPTYFVHADLQARRLVAVLPRWQPETYGIHALLPSQRHLPLALRLLIDFLAERFGDPVAPWDLDRQGA